jgi:hypothetical protein
MNIEKIKNKKIVILITYFKNHTNGFNLTKAVYPKLLCQEEYLFAFITFVFRSEQFEHISIVWAQFVIVNKLR